MPDWIIAYLGSLQGGIVRTLAVELRADGSGAMGFAFGRGALHALTPGHGKAALAAYFLGREATHHQGTPHRDHGGAATRPVRVRRLPGAALCDRAGSIHDCARIANVHVFWLRPHHRGGSCYDLSKRPSRSCTSGWRPRSDHRYRLVAVPTNHIGAWLRIPTKSPCAGRSQRDPAGEGPAQVRSSDPPDSECCGRSW